jgi:hypothetical protein
MTAKDPGIMVMMWQCTKLVSWRPEKALGIAGEPPFSG